jgi:hypothetical protein
LQREWEVALARLQDVAAELAPASAPLLVPCRAEEPILQPQEQQHQQQPLQQQPLQSSPEQQPPSPLRTLPFPLLLADPQAPGDSAAVAVESPVAGAASSSRAAQASVVAGRLEHLRVAAAAASVGLPAMQAAHSLARSGAA